MQGLFVGSSAPYGYLKDPNNKNKLIVNNETAEVIRYIFNLLLTGYGTVEIARKLTSEKILTPSAYKAQLGDMRYQRYNEFGNEYTWTDGAVYKILKDQTYIGDMVNSKTYIANYKTKKCIINTKDKRIVVPNTHEAIITKEDFYRVQELYKYRHNMRKKYHVDNLFRGLIRCSVCGRALILTTRIRRGKLETYYRCNTFTGYRLKEAKHWTTIKYEDIKEIVISKLKEYFSTFKNDKEILDLIRSTIKSSNITIDYEKELSKIKTRQNILSNITKKVYDDYFEELINEDTYLDLIKKYQNEQKDLNEKHNLLLIEQKNKDNYHEDIAKSFLDLKVLNQQTIYSLIESIEIANIGGYKQHKQRIVTIAYRLKEPKK